ncbi:MAG: electron transport complex subunit RsxC [Cellvibrionaceae bacterium]
MSTQLIPTKTWETPGGVHPPENKSQSMQLPLADWTIPEELLFPVSQHLGAPAEPIVSIGDTVLTGQKIAEAVGPMSVPIHASTSGTIVAIEDRVLPHTSGMSGLCIVLKSDGKHNSVNFQGAGAGKSNYRSLSPKILIEKIRDAGIAGMGGAGFPTAIKLNPRNDSAIDTLILNGTECEPYITADDRLMQDFSEDIIQGAKLLAFILGEPKRVIIGIEDNKPDAIKAMRSALEKLNSQEQNSSNIETALSDGTALSTEKALSNIEIATFPTKYPSGGEKQLIQILTGKEVPSGKIPSSLGIVVQNVGTAMAAYRAVCFGEPLTWRITTVVGEALNTQRNVKVLLGTPVAHLLKEHGFDKNKNARLIMGGPMMGFALPDADVAVVKTTNCIIAPSHAEMPAPPPAQACIRCGLCAEACPASLLPQQLYWYARAEDYEKLQNHNLFDCIECGACSYVCPSTIPLVQYYRAAKGVIREKEQEKTKSDHARQRFEFRKQRIEQAEKEKEAKRLARKQAAEKAKKLAAEKKAALSMGSDSIENQKGVKQETSKTSIESDPIEKTDPVAAAMARVQAQQQDPAVQEAKLKRAVDSSQSRVDKLKTRLNEAEGDQQDKLAAQLKQAELRLEDAQKKLDAFLIEPDNIENKSGNNNASGNDSSNDHDKQSKNLTPAPPKALDAAAAAIERAKAKSEAMAAMSPEEKLKSQLSSLETRVEKARAKLKQAEADNSEHIDTLRLGLEKMETKLATTQQAIKELESN